MSISTAETIINPETQKHLVAAEEYAQSVSAVPWDSVERVVNRVVQLREDTVSSILCPLFVQQEMRYHKLTSRLSFPVCNHSVKHMTCSSENYASLNQLITL